MHSTTEIFIRLQNIYQQKANADANKIVTRVASFLTQLGRVPTEISEQEIKIFCRNALYLGAINYRSYETEISEPLPMEIEEEFDLKYFYITFRAIEKFYLENKRYPSDVDTQLDINSLKNYIAILLPSYGLQPSPILDNIAVEMYPPSYTLSSLSPSISLLLIFFFKGVDLEEVNYIILEPILEELQLKK